MFNEAMGDRGKAILGSVTNIPFESDSFDFLLVVTTLMYVPRELDKALSAIWRVLRPGGKCLLIENNRAGVGVYSLGGLINKLRRRPSSDYSFAFGEIDRAVAGLGGSIIQRHGCVTLTFCLLPSYLLSKLSEGLTRRLLDLSFRLDNRLRNRIRLSLYISYFIEKGEVE